MSPAMTTARLEGKVAIITGAGVGIGAECARVLAEHGARVCVVDINLETATQTAAEIVAAGGDAFGWQTDVRSEAEVRAMVAAVVERYGRIDVLHNNAAALGTPQRHADRDVCNVDIDAWDNAMNVNVRGAMLCCKHVIPVMLQTGGGSIIHSASGFGLLGDVTLTSYAASKAALMQLSRSVAAQYGKQGVRSNAVMIGFVINDHAQKTVPQEIKDILLAQHLTPALGHPRQIANAVLFLASDESSFITGDTLAVDGGFTSHSPAMVPMREFFERAGSNKL